jgi:2-dehydro-3-deoxy-D-arabinonate dehydratase
MKLYKTSKGFIIRHEGNAYLSKHSDWNHFINRENLYFELLTEIQRLEPNEDYNSLIVNHLEAPIAAQEIWAAGVTYLRSRDARMEESKKAGGGNFYDKVYDADRPEIFFKATPQRVVGSGNEIRIRKDSFWNVPEPELTLFINKFGKISGYTIGNDMSSRDIEGENPLYLPQAKTYDKSAAIGPCILITEEAISPETEISIEIMRDRNVIFQNSIAINQMKRKHDELVGYLFRECSFEQGCFLMTGTGIVPPDNFSLQVGDDVHITIDGIGTLKNKVSQ